jgi:hypothetical protein
MVGEVRVWFIAWAGSAMILEVPWVRAESKDLKCTTPKRETLQDARGNRTVQGLGIGAGKLR